ncbi:MAG: hypothetical protein SFX73_37270 [Kofleriaceae bacterium]|nr:hypothetical protein [Kofleriaceae bacterium]
MIRHVLLVVACAAGTAEADEDAVGGVSAEDTASERTAAPASEAPPVASALAQATPVLVPELQAGTLRMRVYGSLRPSLSVIHNDATLERDRWAYGVSGSRVDLGVDAAVGGGVSAVFYVRVASDRDAMGDTVARIDLERALVRYAPIPALRFSLGRDQIPLSAQSATPTVGRVFPSRIALDNAFVLPGDVGAQAQVMTSKLSAFAGVWNGVAADAMLAAGASERGLLYTTRLEVTPLGAFAFDEGVRPAQLRVGIGAAFAYRSATQFTATGAEGGHSRALRASASLRAAWQGLFVQAELLRKQITDDLSSRPDVATAVYAQASWRFAMRQLDLAPLARAGVEDRRQLSAPARATSLELGVAAFPLARATDRLQVNAMYEHHDDPDVGASQLVRATLRLSF